MAKQDVCGSVEDMLVEYLAERDLEAHKVEYKKEGPDWVLRVYLDKIPGVEPEYVGIEECEEVTRYLSDMLDEIDMIDRSYNLEVSSPGLDRELVKDADFDRFAGRIVEVKLYEQIDGTKQLTGILNGLKDGNIEIGIGDDGSENKVINIPREKVSKINLAVIF